MSKSETSDAAKRKILPPLLAVSGLTIVAFAPVQPRAANLTTLVSFSGTNGAYPVAGLTADANGNLFGTTQQGGASFVNERYAGDGTVFEIARTASGYASTPTTLVSFNGTNGASPQAGLIADANGNLFGTTSGTVFEIVKTAGGYASTPSTLSGANGANPQAGLIADANGNLFGTTYSGGANNAGTVFEIARTASGYARTPTILVSFNGTNGANPRAGLIADASGNLFGTTYSGGANNAGTVFEIARTASGYASTPTILVSFNGTNGRAPFSGLIADANGNLFGTTAWGGMYSAGNVFEIAKTAGGYASSPITLFTFNYTNGTFPSAGLIADANGNLFGTTRGGVAFGYGTVFELTGTGFVTAAPFNAFKGKLYVQLGKWPNTDGFELVSEFTLGQSSNGINPPAEPLTLKVGTFTTTIPAGSFKGDKDGPFHFEGVIGGVRLEMLIMPMGAKRYSFLAETHRANLAGTTNPVTVTLTIGGDTGTTPVKADIDRDRNISED